MLGGGARRSWCLRIVLAFACVVFLGVFPYLAAVNNPNENVRTFMTMAIVEDGTLRIDRMVQRHGWINDMAKAPDAEGREHLYSVKGPAISWLGVPPYWAFVKLSQAVGVEPPAVSAPAEERAGWLRRSTFVMRFFTLQIPCFVFLVLFERWLRKIAPDVVFRATAVVAAGLGTNFLAYSQMFVSHAAFACASFGSFALVTGERLRFPDDPRARRTAAAFGAGFLAGFATLLEYHGVVVSALLGLYALTAFRTPKQLAAFAVGGALDVSALMFFQWRAYGNPLTPGHKMLENASYKAFHVRGVFGVEPPNLEHAKELLFSPTFGFLGTSPYMWLALLAIPAAIFWPKGPRALFEIQRTAVAFAVVTMIVLVLAVSGAVVWRGGWTIGPRLVGAAPPFFACGAAYGLERLSHRAPRLRTPLRAIAGGLACASVVQIGLVGLVYNTVPEDLTRPLRDFAIPFVRAGYAPWHLGDALGLRGPGFFWVVLACLALAALCAAFWPAGDGRARLAARVAIALPVFVLALRPAFSPPRPQDEFERFDSGLASRRSFTQIWEPKSSDPLRRLRTLADNLGREQPCRYGELAHVEAILSFESDAKTHQTDARGERRCR